MMMLNNSQDNLFIFKVLIVGNHKTLTVDLTTLLSAIGCKIDFASTGNQAINMYHPTYDIIILDTDIIPEMDLGVCIAIRSQENLKHIPIIAISNCQDKRDECIGAGVDEFMTRPIFMEQFRETLTKWIFFHVSKEPYKHDDSNDHHDSTKLTKDIIRKAIKGDAESQYEVGCWYHCQRIFVPACYWLELAAKKDHIGAKFLLNQIKIDKQN